MASYLRNDDARTGIQGVPDSSMVMARHADPRDGTALAHEDSFMDHAGHGLHIAGCTCPVNTHCIEVHGRDEPNLPDEPSRWEGAETSIIAENRRDLLLVGIADSFSCSVRLKG